MKLLGVQVDECTRAEARASLDRPQIIFTPNPEIILEATHNKTFNLALKKGTLMLPDGHGLLLVSTLLKIPSKIVRAFFYLPALFLFVFYKAPFKSIFSETIHGSDFMLDLIEWSVRNQKKVFFLGGKPGVAKKTADLLKNQYPSLIVAGFSNEDPGEIAFEQVKLAKTEVLLVAYGAPKQELWISLHAHRIPTLVHAMGVGGSFDFLSGEVKRAPIFFRRIGFEWMWRLFLQPCKRARRIFNATIRFPLISLFGDDC